jgi:hypothetical protein
MFQRGYSPEAYPTKSIAEKELLRARLIQWAYVLNGGEFVPKAGEYAYSLFIKRGDNRLMVADYSRFLAGEVFFKTRELAEEAMSKFTKDELIKMLS